MSKRFLKMTGAITAGLAAFAYSEFRKEIVAANERVAKGARFVDGPQGPIEVAEAGTGAPVLVIHGAGGGFDQGLDLGRAFLGDGFHVIAPSRFGYLGTAVPPDATAEAQADAHAAVLDALHVDRVAVTGVSAGAPSAMQFALRHRDRCSALVLAVPLAYAPDRPTRKAPSPLFATFLNAMASSDLLFWLAMKITHATVVRTILGTPVEVYAAATAEERTSVDAVMRAILPMSRRAAGIRNDGSVAATLPRYALEDIHVPTLVISAADCLYETYESALYTAEHIPYGRFVGFRSGGHLLVGHDAEVRALIADFLHESQGPGRTAAAM